VTRVEPGGFTKVSALGVQEQRTRVILELTSPRADWAALGDAWRVETEFITRQEENAVQVPASALFRTAATECKHTPAPLPYSLSALQKEAGNRFGMSPDEVLKTAQSLYEKHKITSYPRTPCWWSAS